MGKIARVWTGTEWVDIATQAPSTSGPATTSALSAHEAEAAELMVPMGPLAHLE